MRRTGRRGWSRTARRAASRARPCPSNIGAPSWDASSAARVPTARCWPRTAGCWPISPPRPRWACTTSTSPRNSLRRLEQVRDQAAELAASRDRVVAGQDAERRRIQRNLHDGVQQEIVALSARAGLVRQQLLRGDPAAADGLVDMQRDLASTLEDVREIAYAARGHRGSVQPGGIADGEACADATPAWPGPGNFPSGVKLFRAGEATVRSWTAARAMRRCFWPSPNATWAPSACCMNATPAGSRSGSPCGATTVTWWRTRSVTPSSRSGRDGAELLADIPVALYPVWLIVLSYRLPGHLADRVGFARRSSPRGPGSRASSTASGHMVMRGEGHTV